MNRPVMPDRPGEDVGHEELRDRGDDERQRRLAALDVFLGLAQGAHPAASQRRVVDRAEGKARRAGEEDREIIQSGKMHDRSFLRPAGSG